MILFGTLLNIDAQIPTEGLVGYWPFSGNANDESGNENHGIVHGATLTEDRFGNADKAYVFANNTDDIEVLSSTELQLDTSYKISLWINPLSSYGKATYYCRNPQQFNINN